MDKFGWEEADPFGWEECGFLDEEAAPRPCPEIPEILDDDDNIPF